MSPLLFLVIQLYMEYQKIKSKYNYTEAWNWLQQKGTALHGSSFQLYEEDKHNIYLLLCWFMQDEVAAPQLSLDLHKGILLSGPVGCGKTTLMGLMRFIAKEPNRFMVKSCRNISFEFIEDGFSVIHRYSKSFGNFHQSGTICFDDLGTEGSLKYYGNECNVMAEILLTRYDLFVSQKIKTHITTNLSATEIEGFYGNRVRSRLREMFNLIAFDGTCHDKRK